MNATQLMGRLTRDSELKKAGASDLLEFSVAVDRHGKDKEADFFRCKMWGERGPKIAQWLKKGKLILLEGRLSQERWEKDGQKRSEVIIVVSNVHFIPGTKDADFVRPGDPSRIAATPEAHTPPSTDDIPF